MSFKDEIIKAIKYTVKSKVVQYITLSLSGWLVIMFGLDYLHIDFAITFALAVSYIAVLTSRYSRYFD